MSHYSDIDNPPDRSRKRKLYARHFDTEDGRILDIGCSTGNFLQHHPDRCFGVDLDREALLIARERGLRCVRSDITAGLPFQSDAFQAVNCDSVLEHVHAPLALMREIRRVLAPGGLVVAITPDIYRVGRRFWRDYTHVHPFCRESLKRLAYDAGLESISVHSYALNYLKGLARPSREGIGKHPFLWAIEDAMGAAIATNLILRARKPST